MDLRPVALALVVSAACRGHEAAPAMRHESRVFAGGVAPSAGAPLASENSFRGDRQSAAEGERTFGVMNCDGCHGGGAVGWVGPSLRDRRWRLGGADRGILPPVHFGQSHGMAAFCGPVPLSVII